MQSQSLKWYNNFRVSRTVMTQDKQKQIQVVFQPSGRRGSVEKGISLLEAARRLGEEIEALCGGKRTCGKCKVRLVDGLSEQSSITYLSPLSKEEESHLSAEEIERGYRLACATTLEERATIFVPQESRGGSSTVRKEIALRLSSLDPAIKKRALLLSRPTIEEPLGDWERLHDSLRKDGLGGPFHADYQTLRELSRVTKEGHDLISLTLWEDRYIQRVEPGRKEEAFGVAIDIGTTTLALYLCHLQKGEVLATESMMNPQVIYGEDVMARITYAMSQEDGLQRMHQAIIEALNQGLWRLVQKAGLSPEDIAEVVVVGNTLMHHVFLNIEVECLGKAPFNPVLHQALDLKARDLGLSVHPSANVHLLPIEAGFVGADNVGVLIAQQPYKDDAMSLIIDIGTNGELLLGNREALYSASCATGPAFEGAHIKFGMRAAPGAIERVRIDPDTFEVTYKVIGEADGEKPRGICGSGIIEAVAQLHRAGIIKKSGLFEKELPTLRLRKASQDGYEFVLAWADETSIQKDITITQKDIRAVQLAKAALYAGAKVLMRKRGIKDLDKVILAGAFGSYIDKAHALALGLFPSVPLYKVEAVGNAAGYGACLALLSLQKRREAQEMAGKVHYLELTLEPDFERQFIKAMHLPHMEDPFVEVPL